LRFRLISLASVSERLQVSPPEQEELEK